MCLLFYGDFDIAVFVFYLQGILCLIFRTDKLSVISVSYTHLDVYKRQDMDFHSFISCEEESDAQTVRHMRF